MSIRGLVYCVDEVTLISTEDGHSGQLSRHHGPLGSAEKAGSLRVLDFVTSPPSRFYPLEHFIKTPKHQNPTIASTCLVVPVFGRAFFSLLLSNSSLSWAGKEEGREERTFLLLLPSLPLWCS